MNIILDYQNVCEKNQTYICLLGGPGNPSTHKLSLTFNFHISLFFSPYSDPHVGKKKVQLAAKVVITEERGERMFQ